MESNQGLENGGFQLQESNGVVLNPSGGHKASIINNKDKTRRKSLVHITKEVLPRLENYRNSWRSPRRPSLGELHSAGDDYIKDITDKDDYDPSSGGHEGLKLGWIQGVLIPVMLNIFGVMLFLRVSWVVAEAGTGYSMVIVGISTAVCVVTTLSLSAICTNGEVKGGGIYYIISRSLGPEFGASIGIVFAFANSVSAAMNTIGFCNSLSDLLNKYNISIIDSADNNPIGDARVVGTVASILMILICSLGMDWESKAQNFLIAGIAAAMVDFIIGACAGPFYDHDKQLSKGFVGFNSTVWKENWYPDWRRHEGEDYDFFKVFAIFFPSVTGIQAGANISGDLKDPASAIPKGTLLALLITMSSYAVFLLLAAGTALRDASGMPSDLINGTIGAFDCVDTHNCTWGLHNNYQMLTIMSAWWPLIYVGCWAACLSTALTNLLSVPRLIQALGIDQIYPGLIFFSKGYGKHKEPFRGYVLTFLVAEAFLLIGELNSIAPLISNFYLASYALINFCTFHAALIKPLGWRPTFKYYNMWLSLVGFISCVVIMFLINWKTSLITFIVILGLYLVVVYRKPDVNWGSSTQAQTYKTALSTTQKLNNVGEHVKNYKPQILVLCGSPKHRPPLLDFANLITKNHSLLIVGDIIQNKISHKTRFQRVSDSYAFLKSNKIKAFYSVIDSTNFETGAKALLQVVGIGKLTPNVLMMGYKSDWVACPREDLAAYFNILHEAFDHHMAVAILRVDGGLDYSSLTEIEDTSYPDGSNHTTRSLPPLGTSSSSPNIMHADSNLSLFTLNQQNNQSRSASNAGEHSVINNKGNVTSLTPQQSRKKKSNTKLDIVLNMSTDELFHVEDMNRFRKKQEKGFIDVWWLYDDGGLTMLLPYIISTRNDWSHCKLRVYGLASNKKDLAVEERNMAQMLSKFRLEYSSLKMVSLSDRPQENTINEFKSLLEGFSEESDKENDCYVTEIEMNTNQEKTYRNLRLRELLMENSSGANLIVMSLPMPRKGSLSAPLYMAWLETLTKNMPPFLMVRGNQQSVLTFYS